MAGINMNLKSECVKLAKNLMEHPTHKLSFFEAMTIAVQLQRNNLLKEAFGLRSTKKAVLEDIASSLRLIEVLNEKFVIESLKKKKASNK